MRKILCAFIIFFYTHTYCYAQDFSQLNTLEETNIKCIPDKKHTNDNILYFTVNDNKIYNKEGKLLKNVSISKSKIQINYQNYDNFNAEIRTISINRSSGKYNSSYTINSFYTTRRGQSIGFCSIEENEI